MMPDNPLAKHARSVLAQRQLLPFEIQCRNKFLVCLLCALLLSVLPGCKGTNINYDQVPIFESYFEEGISRKDVEQKLAELGKFDMIAVAREKTAERLPLVGAGKRAW